MTASERHTTRKLTASNVTDGRGAHPPTATIFTAFGVGQSYLFHVKKGGDKSAKDCWKEIFDGDERWGVEQLDKYNKPLGEPVTFTVNAESKDGAEEPDLAEAIANLRDNCDTKLVAKLDGKEVEAIFFTTGVAVLVLRVGPKSPGDTQQFFDTLQDQEALNKFGEGLKIIQSYKKLYTRLMNQAAARKFRKKSNWSLSRFEDVDRDGWDPRVTTSYPLFFVDDQTYELRISRILEQVAGSPGRRARQSDGAKLSYNRSEIYVDWSEGLVKNPEANRGLIENNFIIALASWFALFLMNKNSSTFLLEAFIGIVTKKPQSTAKAVRHRSMAYMDVASAALPIRWTTRRRDLYLLETIERNWSSKRWRKNIEERMKLLALHYESLEDERYERTSRRLNMFGIALGAFTLVSAISVLITLYENDQEVSRQTIWGYGTKQIDFYLSLSPLVAGSLLLGALWLGRKFRLRGQKKRLPKVSPANAWPTEIRDEN